MSVLFFLAVLLVVAYPSPAQDSVARTATTRETRQVKVITSGGFTAAFNILGPMFAQATGIEVITEYGSSMGGGPESIPVRLERGETADLLIFNGRAFDDLGCHRASANRDPCRPGALRHRHGCAVGRAEAGYQHRRSVYRDLAGRGVHRLFGQRQRHVSVDRGMARARDLGRDSAKDDTRGDRAGRECRGNVGRPRSAFRR